MMYITRLFVLTCLFLGVQCDYKCICNYHVQRSVYGSASNHNVPIGFLFEFDCGATLPHIHVGKDWAAIIYNNRIGYIKVDQEVHLETCTGPQPTVAISQTLTATLISLQPSSSQSTTPTSTLLTATLTSTTQQTRQPSTNLSTTLMPTTTVTIARSTMKSSTATTTTSPIHGNSCGCSPPQGHYSNSCYELVQYPFEITRAEAFCVLKGGHLARINNDAEQSFIQSYLIRHAHSSMYQVLIGYSDYYRTGVFRWASANSAGNYNADYTNWKYRNPQQHHCAAINWREGGVWDSVSCGSRFSFLCQYSARALGGGVASLIGHLSMHRVSVIWETRLLVEDNKENRIKASRKLLKQYAIYGDDVSNSIVTTDDAWLFLCGLETKSSIILSVNKNSHIMQLY